MMKMPKVTACDITQCAYNLERKCHALAITVGDGAHPQCDTFCPSSTKGGDAKAIAGVGACKVSQCQHNKNLECQAQGIQIGYMQNEVDCLTFKPI